MLIKHKVIITAMVDIIRDMAPIKGMAGITLVKWGIIMDMVGIILLK